MSASTLRIRLIVLACFATAGLPFVASAGTDAFYVPPPAPMANDAPSYESDYTASMRLKGSAQNTPEADARPGEYYFLMGAEAFRKHDYTFAMQMYQVAASWAFKPAEYNLGVMYSRGQGVPVDMPRAMAWMALAAERDDKHYVDAREAVYAELSPEQFAQANEIWRELKKTYGDEVALRRAKARWAEVKSNMTGSKVGSGATPLLVGMPNPGMRDPSGPKLLVHPEMQGPRSTTSAPGQAAGGDAVDGSVAYRQLRESDNPYDPKFERSPSIGLATVGSPTTVKPEKSKSKDNDGEETDTPAHER